MKPELIAEVKSVCRKIRKHWDELPDNARLGTILTWQEQKNLINQIRYCFAEISLGMLNPDLVIMDEFQRFKDLIEIDENDHSDGALLDEKDSLGEIDSRQVCAVCGDSIIPHTNANIYTHSRFIKQRGALVPKIICNKEKMTLEQDFDNFTLGQYLIIKALMLNYYCADANSGLLLKDWFVQETTIDDWAEFLKDYDLFSVYKKKEWTDQRIKKVRDLIKQMTIK
jgi:hypothetical protein